MTSLKDRLTLRNLTNVFVRLPLATFLIHEFTKILFDTYNIYPLIQLSSIYPYFQLYGSPAKDMATLQKMMRFWPPHKGYGVGEFTLAYTITLIMFLRLIDLPTVIHSLLGFRFHSRILNFLVTPPYASFILFVILLPMMRLAEMHAFVLVLNWIHITVSFYIVYLTWYFLKSTSSVESEKKEKTE